MPHLANLSRFRLPAFVLAVALLGAVGLAMVLSIREFTRKTDRVEHSYQVMAAAEAVRSAVRSVESDARGFRLSNRSADVAQFMATTPQVHAHAAELVALTRDNPAQNERSRRLQGLAAQRLRSLQRLVEAPVQADANARLTVFGGGYELMQRINALTDEILIEERELLRQRNAAAAEQANLLTAIVVAGIVLPLVLLGALMWGLARENRRSAALEREARKTLRELAESLEQRGRLSEQRRLLGVYAGLLQSSQTLDEAMAVTVRTLTELLPGAGGRCYVLRASQNQAETAARFGAEVVPSDDPLHPDSCWALRRGQPHHSGPGAGHVRCRHLAPAGEADDAWSLCVPLMAQGTSLGLLYLSGPAQCGIEAAVAESVGEQLSLAMLNLQLRETLRVQSLRDALTGLFNRRYLEENLQRELLRCERRGLPLSVIMLDVDHFKRFNDQHGHTAGDALLARIGQTLQALVRGEDIACRYGGEEFAIVLPETGRAEALQRAEEIRRAIAATTVLHLRRTLGPTTASLGVAVFPGDGDAPAALIECADAALYRAKAAGRDRVVEAAALQREAQAPPAVRT
ncbi:diguanylate cyclase [Vulcaniibacterium tengchongense]|uniref:diguanylate cyclase n=1 Tax=Vulcaniibacterium tengchongense TaxID=1273429 RepID=A0A3N4VNA9_9GAMM|nr:diguanylate cyclase [Vulcaniibacterium tengchongense]RPE81319.1 diguanylate cyclase (GGDEF)-like protein [Vulcaniibacterium tengchongense]